MSKTQNTNPKLFNEWARYAEEDLTHAQLALKEDGPINPICFHTQQVAEKYLKGYLVFYGKRFEKTHQLRYLLESCKEIDPSFEELKEYVLLLNEFYIETRYPGDMPDFFLKDAKEGIIAAKKVKDFVLERVDL